MRRAELRERDVSTVSEPVRCFLPLSRTHNNIKQPDRKPRFQSKSTEQLPLRGGAATAVTVDHKPTAQAR